jgi:hypothetical protein
MFVLTARRLATVAISALLLVVGTSAAPALADTVLPNPGTPVASVVTTTSISKILYVTTAPWPDLIPPTTTGTLTARALQTAPTGKAQFVVLNQISPGGTATVGLSATYPAGSLLPRGFALTSAAIGTVPCI